MTTTPPRIDDTRGVRMRIACDRDDYRRSAHRLPRTAELERRVRSIAVAQ